MLPTNRKLPFELKFTPEPNSGCWLWLGRTNDKGYGVVWEKGGHVKAHRAAWQRFKGEIPNGLHVLHKCDVRCCVNPDHLFLGTHRDNMRDMATKGRVGIRTGEAHWATKLTEAQVIAIRSDTRTGKVLGVLYDVAPSTINMIRRGKNWRFI